MPIDNSFKPLRSAIFAVSAKCGAGASSNGGMHIRPAMSKPYFSRHSLMRASACSGSTPAFCGSAPVLTCTNRSGCFPAFWISFANASQILGRSTEWIASNKAKASFALLDCSGPIRCSAMSGCRSRIAGHLPFDSCTRFSPKVFWPSATACSTASPPKVLLTAINVTDDGSRSASRHAFAISSRTCASPAAMSCVATFISVS